MLAIALGQEAVLHAKRYHPTVHRVGEGEERNDFTPHNSNSPGCIAHMSQPNIKRFMTGALLAIIALTLSSGERKRYPHWSMLFTGTRLDVDRGCGHKGAESEPR